MTPFERSFSKLSCFFVLYILYKRCFCTYNVYLYKTACISPLNTIMYEFLLATDSPEVETGVHQTVSGGYQASELGGKALYCTCATPTHRLSMSVCLLLYPLLYMCHTYSPPVCLCLCIIIESVAREDSS